MKRYVIASSLTGAIVRTVTCLDDQVAVQAGADEFLVEHADASHGSHYVDPDTLEVAALPARPDPHSVFNGRTKVWEDPRGAHQRKLDALAALKAERSKAIAAGLTLAGRVFDTDEVSQSRIQTVVLQALAAKSDNQPFTVEWTLADDSTVTLNRAQVLALGQALQQHNDAAQAAYRNKKAEVAGL